MRHPKAAPKASEERKKQKASGQSSTLHVFQRAYDKSSADAVDHLTGTSQDMRQMASVECPSR